MPRHSDPVAVATLITLSITWGTRFFRVGQSDTYPIPSPCFEGAEEANYAKNALGIGNLISLFQLISQDMRVHSYPGREASDVVQAVLVEAAPNSGRITVIG